MIIGQTIVAVDTSGAGATTTVYTPWVASWGNAAIFSYEIMALQGVVTSFKVRVLSKNTEDADPGTQKGTQNSHTSANTYSITDASGLLELVRLEFELKATKSGNNTVAQALFRVLNPSWKTN